MKNILNYITGGECYVSLALTLFLCLSTVYFSQITALIFFIFFIIILLINYYRVVMEESPTMKELKRQLKIVEAIKECSEIVETENGKEYQFTLGDIETHLENKKNKR
jgi:hypothetical protein